MSKTINPFSFSALPKLSSAELRLANRNPSIEHVLHQHRDISTEYGSASFDNVSIMPSGEYLHLSTSGDCFVVLSWPLKNEFIYLEIDARVAKDMVYDVLSGERPSQSRHQISEVEQGILSFIVLKLLDSHANLGLKLVEIGNSISIVQNRVTQTTSMALLNYRFQQSSFCRIAMSLDCLEQFCVSLSTPEKGESSDLSRGLKRCTAVQVPIIAQVGSVQLKPSELSALDVDDIIVLENCSAHLRELGLTGSVQGQIGLVEQGSFKGNLLLNKSGRYALQVSELVATSQPQSTKQAKL